MVVRHRVPFLDDDLAPCRQAHGRPQRIFELHPELGRKINDVGFGDPGQRADEPVIQLLLTQLLGLPLFFQSASRG
jgi:hypothetical protein